MTMPDGKHLENRYDAEYLRAGTVENGTVTTFSYHNGELLAESSPDGDTISRYIPGYGVAAGWNREKSDYHYYHLDEQNSTAYITGGGGEIENRYEYDAFGVLKNSMEELPNRILYTGQQYDQTSGQYYLRARFYNPVLGRFVQEDVYRGDGLNLYAYCKNNPVVYYDPSGYAKKPKVKTQGEIYIRYMSQNEADKILKNNGLVPIESGGKPSRAAVWISENDHGRNRKSLGGKSGSHDIEVQMTTNQGVKEFLLKNPEYVLDYELIDSEVHNTTNILIKEVEPGSYGIGRDKLEEFNEQIVSIKVTNAKTSKKIAEVELPENKKNQKKLCGKES